MECEAGRRDKDASKVYCSEYQEKRLAIYWDSEDHGNLKGGGSEVHFGHVYVETLSWASNGDIEKAPE